MVYLVKYSTEIGTKSTRMKWKFIQKLRENIRSGLKANFERESWKGMEVHCQDNHILIDAPSGLREFLQRVSGVQYFAEAESFPFGGEEDMIARAAAFFRPKVSGKRSFAVRGRVRKNKGSKRRDIEVALGNELIAEAPVDLDDPEITCFLELDEDRFHLYTQKVAGMGGAPLGVQGTCINLFSGGIDSPVAAWRAYRIGLDQHFLFFDLGGPEQKRKVFELYGYLKRSYGHGSIGKLIEVDMMPVVAGIMKAAPRHQNLILKYVFYRIAEVIGRIHGVHSLISGESLGQVSTQTGKNLATLDRTIRTSVHRPLFAFSKEEITAQAREIGTFERSYKGKEFCALAQKKVTTGASYKELMGAISGLELDPLIEEAIDARILWDLNTKGELEARESRGREPGKKAEEEKEQMFRQEDADRVIDLRSDDELGEAEVQGERIPFEKAMEDYFHWDKDKRYFFVCNYGSKSRIIAHYMQKEGFEAGYSDGGVVKGE